MSQDKSARSAGGAGQFSALFSVSNSTLRAVQLIAGNLHYDFETGYRRIDHPFNERRSESFGKRA